MSSLGDKIKSAFGGGDHSSKAAQTGEVDSRTPGAFPSEEPGVRGGADQPHVGGKPVPSSGSQDLGGTSQDPGFITGPSEHNHEHNKLHKKDDPRGNTGYPSHSSSTAGHGHVHTGAGTATSSSLNPSSHGGSDLATDRQGRPDTSQVPGTGVATGPGTAGGVHASELGSDRSGSKADDFTSGLEGTSAGHTGHSTSGLTGSQHPTSGTTGNQYGSAGASNNPSGTTGTQQPQSGSHSGTGAGLAAGAAAATGAGALAGHDRDSHNTVHNGREKSQIGSGSHEEPYWGNLPGKGSEGTHGTQGTGVYNTVTGHGSGENTAGQHRNLPHRTGDVDDASRSGTSGNHGVTSGAGVYNTVTGHGSNDEHDRAHNSGADRHDRAFPLGTGSQGTTSNPASRDTTSNPLSSGTSSNLREGDNSQRDHHRGGEALGAGAAGAAGAAAGYGASKLGHHDSNNPQHIGERDSTSSTNPTTSHGSTGGASYLPNTSNTSGTTGNTGNTGNTGTSTGSSGGAGALGGATATPQQQTTAGGKDPSRVAASQPTTHETGSMLDVGDVATGPARSAAGPHKSDTLNKADPRVDSDLDGSKTYGADNTTSHTGRNTAGLAGAGAAAGAAYGAHEHNKHGRETETQRGSGLGSSSTQAVGSGIDPTHSDTRSRDTGHSSGGGLLHHNKDEPSSTTAHSHHTTKEDYKDPSAHHHDNKLLGFLHHNKDDKIAGQDAQGSALPSSTQNTGTGYDNTRSTHDDHTGRNAALAGAGAAGAGYGASRLAQHHNEPSVGQRDTGVTGTHGSSGVGPTTGNYGASEGTHGPHSSRVANAADPRVDSDRDGSRGLGSSTGTGTHGTSGLTGSARGNDESHTGRNLAGLGAAAGAGYGAYRVGHHDNDPSSQSGLHGTTAGRDNYNQMPSGSSGVAGTAPGSGLYTSGAPGHTPQSTTHSTPGQGQYNTLNDGTPSGIATGANHGTSTGVSDTRGAPSSTGITGGTHSHGGHDQYNTLSSGTPSGVSVGDQQGSHSSNVGSGAGTGHTKDSTSHGLGSGVGAGALGGGGLAAAAAKLRNGGRVTHNCTECGKENDISKYFSQ